MTKVYDEQNIKILNKDRALPHLPHPKPGLPYWILSSFKILIFLFIMKYFAFILILKNIALKH